jgi:hypothetical protein
MSATAQQQAAPTTTPASVATAPEAMAQSLEQLPDSIASAVWMQCKLNIGAADDPLEQEADRVADTIMRMSIPGTPMLSGTVPGIQRKCAACAQEEELQRKPFAGTIRRKGEGSGQTAPPAITSRIHATRGSGGRMDSATQLFMGSRFGTDFSSVNIHTGDYAIQMSRDLNARAFTVGNDIYFDSGQYNPGSENGKHLLAHELTHTVQQGSVQPAMIQRWDTDNAPIGDPVRDPHVRDALQQDPTPAPAPVPDTGDLNPVMPDLSQNVIRIVVSCTDGLLRFDTAGASYIYHMDTCTVPEGSYETNVSVTGNNFLLTPQVPDHPPGGFRFRYRVRRGQTNPATLLRGQATVHVDVVPHLVAPTDTPAPDRPAPGCLLRLPDQELVPSNRASQPLFTPLHFDQTIWSHPIPLGLYGWVGVSAQASGDLSGVLSGSYGPGMLRNICLSIEQNRVDGSAPIDHPLLGDDSAVHVRTTTLRGFADFNLPAYAALSLLATGRLRISGDYLSVINLAAAEAALHATAIGSLNGAINGRVEISTTVTQANATLTDNVFPVALDLSNTTIGPVSLVAEVGMHGTAAFLFNLDMTAGFSAFGFNLWSQRWNLVNFNPSVGWAGGLRYQTGRGVEWDFGRIDRDSDLSASGAGSVGSSASGFHSSAADVDTDDVIAAILDDHHATVTAPDGLSDNSPLPFIWYKTMDLYPRVMELPNAEDPQQVNRDNGPVMVRYLERGRSVYERFGVASWPAVRRRFQYLPYDEREEPEKERFARLVDRLGYSRTGLDIDHVWDIGLRGIEYDRFDNLWPASNQEQQLAGGRHFRQIDNYRSTVGNINGRYFEIVDIRHPASP